VGDNNVHYSSGSQLCRGDHGKLLLQANQK
jgi:hypothetical protein